MTAVYLPTYLPNPCFYFIQEKLTIGSFQYVQLGGEENPFAVLRGFDEVRLQPNETRTVTFDLTRRDISNWNTTTQNWEVTTKEKVVFIGSSVRDIRLNSSLPGVEL